MLVAPRRPHCPTPTKRPRATCCCDSRSPLGKDGASLTGARNKNTRFSFFEQRHPQGAKSKPPRASIARKVVPFSATRFVLSFPLSFFAAAVAHLTWILHPQETVGLCRRARERRKQNPMELPFSFRSRPLSLSLND